MRIRLFATFAFGFAAGVLALTATLWAFGKLQPRVLEPRAAHATAPSLAPSAVADVLHNPPPAIPGSAPPPVDLDLPGLAMPVAGVDPAKLHSNFDEIHGGHRHEALDIMAPMGTPVLAVAEGNVVKLFTSKDGGLTVYQFDNSGTVCYYYAHLDHYAAGLKEGMLLRKGDVLGYVGYTGDASPDAPHLHFAILKLGPEKQWWKGSAIDPLPYFVRR